MHCNGLYELSACSYGSLVKVVTFMRAFGISLIISMPILASNAEVYIFNQDDSQE